MANIKVDGKTTNLIEYKYKNGNGRLKEMKYANGDTMKATYNQIGQMIGEKWYDLNSTLTAYYKYVYDNSGNIVRSIDMMSKKEYSYIYEDGVLVRSIEYKLEIDTNENITSRNLVNTIRYAYDSEGKLIKKHFDISGGNDKTVIANPIAVYVTQKGKFQSLFNLADFYRDRSGVYHTYTNCWQKYFGYNDLYDLAFYLGTDMKRKKIEFYYANKEWIFLAWKGDYLNLGAGAELGIYNRLYINGYQTFHWLAATKEAMKMELKLLYNGKELINYKPDEKQWWITGFYPYQQDVKANQLKATFKVKFNSSNMFNSFYHQTYYNSNIDGITYNFKLSTATIKF